MDIIKDKDHPLLAKSSPNHSLSISLNKYAQIAGHILRQTESILAVLLCNRPNMHKETLRRDTTLVMLQHLQ